MGYLLPKYDLKCNFLLFLSRKTISVWSCCFFTSYYLKKSNVLPIPYSTRLGIVLLSNIYTILLYITNHYITIYTISLVAGVFSSKI